MSSSPRMFQAAPVVAPLGASLRGRGEQVASLQGGDTRAPRKPLWVAVVLTTALLSGCGASTDTGPKAGTAVSQSPAAPSGTPGVSSTAPTNVTPGATSAPVDPRALVRAAVAGDFRRYDRAFYVAIRTRSTRGADLARYATAAQRKDDRDRISQMRRRGIVYTGVDTGWVGPVSLRGNLASLVLCERADGAGYEYAATGKDVIPRRHRWVGFLVALVHRGARWQVASTTASKKSSCAAAKR